MWFLLNKNCVGQKGIRDVKSIKVKKSSSRGTMKMLIGRIKLLFWADEVANYVYNEDANWADKVTNRGGQSHWLSAQW